MPRNNTILPPSSSDLEVDLFDAFKEVMEEKLQVPNIPIKFLWNADLCPTKFLPHLACAFSVDGDPADFSTTQLRNLIKNSLEIHLRKGTVWSVKQVVEDLGYGVTSLIEGDRDGSDNIIRDDGRWAHFAVEIDTPISIAAANATVALIQALAPVSRKLVLFTYTAVALRYDGGVNDDGDFTLFSDGTFTHGEVSTDTEITQ